MLQKINLVYRKSGNLDYFSEDAKRLRIDVFTSKYCTFCNYALEVARTAAGKVTNLPNLIEVVETPVDDQPELIEALNLVALPLIQIGRAQIIGLPTQDDVERLIKETILMS